MLGGRYLCNPSFWQRSHHTLLTNINGMKKPTKTVKARIPPPISLALTLMPKSVRNGPCSASASSATMQSHQ